MPTATDDSGPAAVSVSPSLLGLRQTCDRMDIKWHWRHKESTLEGMINDKEAKVEIISIQASGPSTEHQQEQRSIPQDVLDALDYCNSYHRANTARIKEYIESIL